MEFGKFLMKVQINSNKVKIGQYSIYNYKISEATEEK